jgi:hypothetical protein
MLQEQIFDEIKQIPSEKLAEIYDLIHYFRIGLLHGQTTAAKPSAQSFSERWRGQFHSYYETETIFLGADMPTLQPYQITSNNQEIVITLNRSLIEQNKLEQFLDYLSLKAIQQKSELTEEAANQLISEIDNSLWEKHKGLFVI